MRCLWATLPKSSAPFLGLRCKRCTNSRSAAHKASTDLLNCAFVVFPGYRSLARILTLATLTTMQILSEELLRLLRAGEGGGYGLGVWTGCGCYGQAMCTATLEYATLEIRYSI